MRRLIIAILLIVVTATLVWLSFYLRRQGMGRGSELASVISLYVSIISGLGGLWLGWLSLREARSAQHPSPSDDRQRPHLRVGRDAYFAKTMMFHRHDDEDREP